jgi:hypothetical protein
MRRARCNQRDLFDEAAEVAALRPDLRAKLTPLLQLLLSEAAGVAPYRSKSADPSAEEAGDD